MLAWYNRCMEKIKDLGAMLLVLAMFGAVIYVAHYWNTNDAELNGVNGMSRPPYPYYEQWLEKQKHEQR